MSYEQIKTINDLSVYVTKWQAASVLAVDTEFVRERTFYPRLGLVQVRADDGDPVLLDPLELDDLTPFGRLLADGGIVKVMHACGEDLEVLHHELGVFPRPLFDTQIAAAHAGRGYSIGLSSLVDELLGIGVPEGETRTDWLRRPLTEEQRIYAVHDVAHLPRLHAILGDELERLGRSEWVFEETARAMDPERFHPDPESAYRRIRGGGSLSGLRLATLRVLAAWRERTARERDLPRGFVVRDRALLDIARTLPGRRRELEATGLSPAARRRHAETLLGLVEEARRLPPSDWPEPPPRGPGGEEGRALLRDLRAIVRARAQELGIPAPSLASRREVEGLLGELASGREGGELPPPFDGWRGEELGRPFRERVERARREGVL